MYLGCTRPGRNREYPSALAKAASGTGQWVLLYYDQRALHCNLIPLSCLWPRVEKIFYTSKEDYFALLHVGTSPYCELNDHAVPLGSV